MKFKTNQIQRVGVKALFLQDGKVFFVKDERGNWELPGGKIEFGERLEAGLKREIKEELGVSQLEIGNLVRAFDFSVEANGNIYHFIVLAYQCFANLSRLKLSPEHSEYAWIGPEDLGKYPMREGYRKVTAEVLKQ